MFFYRDIEKLCVLHLNVWQHDLFKYDQLLGLTGYSRVKMTEDTNILTIHPTHTHTRAHPHTHRNTHRPLHPVHLSVPQQEACCQDTVCFLLDQSKEEKYNFLIKLSLSCHFTASELPCPLL